MNEALGQCNFQAGMPRQPQPRLKCNDRIQTISSSAVLKREEICTSRFKTDAMPVVEKVIGRRLKRGRCSLKWKLAFLHFPADEVEKRHVCGCDWPSAIVAFWCSRTQPLLPHPG